MAGLKEEMALAAAKVDAFLNEDVFPSSVEPAQLREAVASYPARGGKRLRPILAMWSCGALGGEPDKALKVGAAIEIYHNWTLVHDDIIDRDEVRRGEPTAHKRLQAHAYGRYDADEEESLEYGKSFAILAGDVQQAWAVDAILRSVEDGVAPELAIALARRLCRTVNRELISGEALDVDFPYRKSWPDEYEVMKMMSWKTGTLLKFCAQAGGAVGLGRADFEEGPLERLGVFAERLGVAFQLMDDHLGVFGDAAEFGKPLCSDFREGKPTILILKAFARLDERGRGRLEALMKLDHYGQREIEAARKLLRDSGAEEANRALAAKLSAESKNALLELPPSNYRDLLAELADSLLKRHV